VLEKYNEWRLMVINRIAGVRFGLNKFVHDAAATNRGLLKKSAIHAGRAMTSGGKNR
jgi:hypothetical protein